MQNDPMRIMKIPITFCISRASSPVPRHPSGGLTAYFLQILLITPDSIIFLMLKHKTQSMRPSYQFLLVIQNWTIFELLLPSNDKVSIEQIWTIICYLACLASLDCERKLKKVIYEFYKNHLLPSTQRWQQSHKHIPLSLSCSVHQLQWEPLPIYHLVVASHWLVDSEATTVSTIYWIYQLSYSKHAPICCACLSTHSVTCLLQLINVLKWLSLVDH